jgi:hypothetical protein
VENQNPEIKISVPIYVPISKKNKFALNLNEYRNAHYMTLNKAKVVFAKTIMPSLRQVPRMQTLKLHFQLFFGSNRAVDTSNVCCIVEKFFCDALVEAGIIPDDNRDIMVHSSSDFGGVDTKNPRVEVTFYDYELQLSLKEQETPMKIILTSDELNNALLTYLATMIDLRPNQTVDIDLQHGPEGYEAVIDVLSKGVAVTAPAAPPVASVTVTESGAPTTPTTTMKRPRGPAKQPVTITKEPVPVPLHQLLANDPQHNIAAETPAEPETASSKATSEPEEGVDDRGDIFDMTPRASGIEIENDAQEETETTAEGEPESTPTEDPPSAGTKAEKPKLEMFPEGAKPKDAPVDRRTLFAAQNGQKPTPKEAPAAGAVGSLFSGLAKPKHVMNPVKEN